MIVAILGGTGFVGQYLVDALVKQGDRPKVLIRHSPKQIPMGGDKTEWYPGNVEDSMSIRKLLEDSDAVIYNIGILRAFPEQGITFEKLQYRGVAKVAALAQEIGVKRFILMSANGVEQKLTTYQQTKFAAEENLKHTQLDWTIFRPSVIFGNPHGRQEFASMLKKDIICPPLPAPLFYEGLIPHDPGGFKLSPVHVEDVAQAFAQSLANQETIGKTYTMGGPEELSWKEILTLIAQASGKNKLMLPVPSFAPSMFAMMLDRYPWFPISRDQIRMLTKGNTCRGDEIFDICNIQPKTFSPETIKYLSGEHNTGQDDTAPAC
ncbi:MAG: complex I NDUFA9 subunit family protein [Candidatus Thiodiazotropha sp. L084R]